MDDLPINLLHLIRSAGREHLIRSTLVQAGDRGHKAGNAEPEGRKPVRTAQE